MGVIFNFRIFDKKCKTQNWKYRLIRYTYRTILSDKVIYEYFLKPFTSGISGKFLTHRVSD